MANTLNLTTRFGKEELLQKDRQYAWHHMSKYNPNPLIVTEAEGSWITDIEGNRYFDGMSGLWCVNIGYGRQELAEAAYEQMKSLAYYPLTQSHTPGIILAEKLSEWLGDEYRIFFSNSGSEANEVALKMARQYHYHQGNANRNKFISRHRAYHGNTMGALAATGQEVRKENYEPLAGGFYHVPPPYCYRCPFGKEHGSCGLKCAQAIEDMIQQQGAETVAGVIMEPVITGGGIIVPPDDYLQEVRDICTNNGVLLIIDEVICGFGRSGQKFGHHNFGIKPDIVTMAKGITSAYLPLSATAVRADIASNFNEPGENKHFRHVNTFGGHTTACAVALRNLEIIEKEGLIDHAHQLGSILRQKLFILEDHTNVGEIRHFGYIIGIEMVEDKVTKEPLSEDKMVKIMGECKKLGLIIGRNGDTVKGFGNILTLSPPFCTTMDEVDFIVNVLRTVLAVK